MSKIGAHSLSGEISSLKVQWDGKERKETKGLDKKYYDLLMKKIIKIDTTLSGYKMIDSSPYVYEKLKNRLYE